MSKKKVCKTCRLFVEGETCPVCKSSNFSTSWQGRLYVTDIEHSLVAQNVGLKVKGEYAIKVR